jgi:hypothetical protein
MSFFPLFPIPMPIIHILIPMPVKTPKNPSEKKLKTNQRKGLSWMNRLWNKKLWKK